MGDTLKYAWTIKSVDLPNKRFEVVYSLEGVAGIAPFHVFLPMPDSEDQIQATVEMYAAPVLAEWTRILTPPTINVAKLIGMTGMGEHSPVVAPVAAPEPTTPITVDVQTTVV